MENYEKNYKDWLDNIIKNLLIKNFYKKFTTLGKHKIYIKNIYLYLKNELKIGWIKEKSFNSKAKKQYNTLMNKFNYYKKNERLKRLQNKYPTLQITEAYYYLSLKNKFKIKNEDLKLFEEFLDILRVTNMEESNQ